MWNSEQRELFRRKLISRLPDVNNIVDNIDRRDRERVTGTVCDFVNVINDVASSLFRKQINVQPDGNFRVNRSTRAKWFNNECREKKVVYTEALKTLI